MAMPISNTHLRVPRGFGAILEGLTREILRDQPKDIPKYAANYFEALLKQRDESGTDPSEWAANLEDRYYNNHSFKTPDLASKTTVSIKNSQDFMSEDYFGHSEEAVSLATTTTKDSDYTNVTKSIQEKESLTITHKESDNGPAVANEDSTTSTQADRSPYEKITSTDSNHTISHSDSESHDLQLLSEAANIDVCAQESEREAADHQQPTDREEDEPMNVNVEEKTEDEVLVMDEDYASAEQENEPRLEAPVSQLETTEHPVQEEETNNDVSEVVASIEDPINSNTDKSLVEISFEDVPESQQTMNNENAQLVNVEMVENENDKKPSPQERELEVKRQEATEEDKEANYSNDFDDNLEESVDIMDTGHQSTNEADNIEDENTASREGESSQKDVSEKYDNPDFTEGTNLIGDDTNETETEDYLQIEHQEINAQDSESDLSQLTHSNIKTLEEQGDDLEEEHEEENQPEDNLEKYITTSQKLDSEEEGEEHMEKVKLDSEVQEGLSTCEQDNINPDVEERADQEDTGLQEKQQVTLDPEGETANQQEECSRPQEEEDIMDIPLDDPEANRAAAKIQAGFRGHMTRKKMKPEDKTEGEEVSSTGEVLNGSQGGTETGGSGPVGRDNTSVPEQ